MKHYNNPVLTLVTFCLWLSLGLIVAAALLGELKPGQEKETFLVCAFYALVTYSFHRRMNVGRIIVLFFIVIFLITLAVVIIAEFAKIFSAGNEFNLLGLLVMSVTFALFILLYKYLRSAEVTQIFYYMQLPNDISLLHRICPYCLENNEKGNMFCSNCREYIVFNYGDDVCLSCGYMGKMKKKYKMEYPFWGFLIFGLIALIIPTHRGEVIGKICKKCKRELYEDDYSLHVAC